MTYVAPALVQDVATRHEECGAIVELLAVVLILFGGAAAFCVAVCGIGKVQSCDVGWLHVTAVCK
ncbi:MAG TPA: hypothetical protein PKL39_08730 [Bacillota bacterium]|nr:hypothetical protein [Bacillota bacterium]HPZ91228.1 hypothetical protein [Bacillota bacterium]HQE02354.1 hypothetical protein [Bacillota bacterium]